MCCQVSQESAYLILDPLPDNFGHLVAVHVDDGVSNGHFAEAGSERSCRKLMEHF